MKTLREDGLQDGASAGDDAGERERRALDEQAAGLGLVLAEFREEERVIRQDVGLSDQGRTDRLRELSEKKSKEIEKLESGKVEQVEKFVKSIKTRLLPEVLFERDKKDDPAEAAYRAREIRDLLRGSSPSDKAAAIVAAAKRGDKEFLAAIFNGPAAFPLANEELSARALDVYAQKFAADDVRELQLTEDLAEVMRANLAVARYAVSAARTTAQARPHVGIH